ncbi:MAG: DeoR/GlpR transcriptional regulator [Mogibacterium sp.]|nr:DeoR/GlpR transcriptional regulator [Mogibacterium sp.]
MLSEERRNAIVSYIDKNGTATVQDLVDVIDASAATIRRDLLMLHNENRIVKVFGGATSLDYKEMSSAEPSVGDKMTLNTREKELIAEYAASLISDDDFVYIDSGTTTLCMINYITNSKAVYVTNGIVHAKRLIERGYSTMIIGGKVKPTTEAVIGSRSVEELARFNFTKSFMGTNGITERAGFTTPDEEEALVKSEAIKHTLQSYVLADHSKFGVVTPVTFANIWDCCIITDTVPDKNYADLTMIKSVSQQ